MKRTVLMILLFIAPSFAQVGFNPQALQFASHDAFAAQGIPIVEHNLLGTNGYSWAQGERPLLEVYKSNKVAESLGSAARKLHVVHVGDTKARIIYAD